MRGQCGKRRVVSGEKRRTAWLGGDRIAQTRLRDMQQGFAQSDDRKRAGEEKRQRQKQRRVTMQGAERAGLLMLRGRIARLRGRLFGLMMADRRAGKVWPRCSARHAKRAGGELQIKPEDGEDSDELIARQGLAAKAASRRNQCLRSETRHGVIPSRGHYANRTACNRVLWHFCRFTTSCGEGITLRGLRRRLAEEMFARL